MIVGCIYRHPCMDASEFNNTYLQTLLDKLALNKDIFLLGDFNINLLQYDNNKESQEFLDKMYRLVGQLRTNFDIKFITATEVFIQRL